MLNDTFSVIFKHREEANLKWVNALIIFTFILKKKSVIAKGQGRIVLILVKQYHYEDLIDTDDVIYLGWHSPTAWWFLPEERITIWTWAYDKIGHSRTVLQCL